MAYVPTQQEIQGIDELHGKLNAPGIAALDLCQLWKTTEPYWATILAAVSRIPIVGKRLAALLAVLGKALDGCCPNTQHLNLDAFGIIKAEQSQIEAAFDDIFGIAAGEKPCCNLWKKLKKYWPLIVTVARKIPVIGPKLADILQKVGDALDKFCG